MAEARLETGNVLSLCTNGITETIGRNPAECYECNHSWDAILNSCDRFSYNQRTWKSKNQRFQRLAREIVFQSQSAFGSRVLDLAGEHFTDVVQTVNVSRSGCCLPLKRSLAPGQKIHLQRMGSGEEAVGRVVGQTGIRSEHNLYGIEVLNQSDNFWGIRFPRQWGSRFPRQKELEESNSRALLKCAVCQTCHVTALNEVELSVFQITHRLTRMCDVCSANTVWEPVPQKPSPEELLATGKKRGQEKIRSHQHEDSCLRWSAWSPRRHS